jgi:hypothetical protein
MCLSYPNPAADSKRNKKTRRAAGDKNPANRPPPVHPGTSGQIEIVES